MYNTGEGFQLYLHRPLADPKKQKKTQMIVFVPGSSETLRVKFRSQVMFFFSASYAADIVLSSE